jgi:threonine aldolase
MRNMAQHRRNFLKSIGASALALQRSAVAQSGSTQNAGERRVFLQGDGINLTPAGYAGLLVTLARPDSKPDVYLKGGPVEQLETRFASILGKERALFFPTGTLANHVAVRLLAGERRHVLVQEESHLYRDEGDCAQLLSGLNLVPLAPGRATIKASEIEEAVERAAAPPYPVPAGAISIESPVRRTRGQAFDFEEMKKISAFAREKKIGMHLDGARMFLASAYTGISPATYSALFDTVYVSLYKYFNAPFGAILAGPGPLMDAAAILRHQFGGALLHAWQSAAVALHYLDGFEQRYQQAMHSGEEVFRLMGQKGLHVERVESGTNIGAVHVPAERAQSIQQRLEAAGIVSGKPLPDNRLVVQINETILRRPPEEIATALVNAMA